MHAHKGAREIVGNTLLGEIASLSVEVMTSAWRRPGAVWVTRRDTSRRVRVWGLERDDGNSISHPDGIDSPDKQPKQDASEPQLSRKAKKLEVKEKGGKGEKQEQKKPEGVAEREKQQQVGAEREQKQSGEAKTEKKQGGGGKGEQKQGEGKGVKNAAVNSSNSFDEEEIPSWWWNSKKRFKQPVFKKMPQLKNGQSSEGLKPSAWVSAEQSNALKEKDKDNKAQEDNEGSKLSRQVFIVCLIFAAFATTITSLVHPPFMEAVKRGFTILASVTGRLITGTKSSEYALEAVVLTGVFILLRFTLIPVTRRFYFWWTDSTSEKAWTGSSLYWVLFNVYGPIELSLVAVAGMRFLEAGLEKIGLIQATVLNSVVEKAVICALVIALTRVALSWQERYFTQKAFELELEGKTLQSERLSGLNKLSNIATYMVTVALGLKVLGVDIRALVTFGGISGLAIGLAGRQILENAFMGLMLYATAPFMPGDEIKFSTSQEKDIEGIVIDIGLFRTTIKSFQREVFIVPNSLFSSLVLLNVTRKGKEWRIRTDILVRLQDAPRVPNMLTNFRSLLKSDDRVLRSLHRRVFLERVTSEGLLIHLSFYVEAINKDQFFAIQQDLLQKFLETCKNNNVRIATPIRGVMPIQGDDGLIGPLVSKEAVAALVDDEESEQEKREENKLAAALSTMSGGMLRGNTSPT